MKIRTAFVAALAVVAAVAVTGCGHLMMMMPGTTSRARPKPNSASAPARRPRPVHGDAQPDQPLRPRRMQTVRVAIADAAGEPVDDATIGIDGGMPQHGHGLPTRPRVTSDRQRHLRDRRGALQHGRLVGVQARRRAPAGADVVTFNLAL